MPKTAHSQILVDLYGQGAIPQMQFSNKGFNNGLGFGFGIMSNPLNSRNIKAPTFVQIHAGGNFAFTGFGTKKFELELAEPQTGLADVKISNIDFILTPTIRAVFGHGRVQPYIDGFAGMHFLSATQTVKPKKQSFNTEYEEETQTNLANAATYFAGLSAGALFKLSESVYLNAGVSYGWGGIGNILPDKNIVQDGNELNYTFTRSRTDMLLLKFGFTFKAERSETNNSYDYTPDHKKNTPSRPRGKSNELKKNPTPKVGY
ncbi:MAG: hypothetical protein ACXWDO_13190 [Bacteroidia bacterium]